MLKFIKTDRLIIIFIIILSIFTLKDLLRVGYYTSHDGLHQVARLYHFDKALRDGQIPPRWVGDLLNGFGYPLFEFSYQMPWYIAEPMYLSGISVFDSIKYTFILGFVLSGITMYIFQRELYGRLAAFVGSIIYLYSPYRFSNIFVRGAIGDATSFIFPPLLFLSLYKLKKLNKIDWKWISIGSIALTGLILSHAMIFLFFTLSVALYFVFFTLFRQIKRNLLLSGILLILMTIGLSAYYFIPSITEKSFTKFDDIMGPAYIGKSFINFKSLLYSTWGYGTVDAPEGAMSLQVGITQWFIFILAFFIIISLLFKKKKFASDNNFMDAVFFLLLFMISILMTQPVSLALWKMISRFAVIDFTFRILCITVFSASILSGFIMSRFKYPLLLAVFIIGLAFYANRNHIRINKTLDWPLDLIIKSEITTNSNDEYTPKWINSHDVKKPIPKVEFTDNEAKIVINKTKSNYLDFDIDVFKKGLVKINTVYFPGWIALVNGTKKDIIYESSGFMEIPLEVGHYDIQAKFIETPLRKLSDMITITTAVLIVIIFIKPGKKYA